MKLQLSVAGVGVSAVGDAALTLTYDGETHELPQASCDVILAYGLRRKLQDTVAGKSNDPKGAPKLRKLLDALVRGEVELRESPTGDPVLALAVKLADTAVRSTLRKRGETLADYVYEGNEAGDASIRAAARANAPAFLEKAREMLEEESGIQSISVQL